MLLIGQLSGAFTFVVEEKFLGDFENLDPYYMVGIEGLFAVGFWVILLPILQIIPCNDPNLCQNGSIEDTLGAFTDYQKQPLHFLWSALILILVPIF